MTPDDTLSPQELAEVTGKARAASQAAALARLGVPFIFLGRAVKVSRVVAQAHALLPQTTKPKTGVDFSRVR
jgi:3-hydroxyisobutyrate dehydrogenase-like beta-hydroxyacid dehydrogenase